MKNLANGAIKFGAVIFLLLLSTTGFSQLKAGFTSSSNAGCSPLVVQFNDASEGSPVSYSWNFGNGLTSTLANPGALYKTPGKYTVTLTVTDAGGNSDTIVKTDYITVYAAPAVDFNFTPQDGCSPLIVAFKDNSSAGSGSETSWNWDFGDGQLSARQNPAHTYSTVDTFSVSLTVTNSFGCASFVTKQNVIKVDGVNSLDFDYSYQNACTPPTKVTFTNTVNTPVPVSYQWLFGDGNTSTETNPVYTYTANGIYNVQLITTTTKGCSDTVTKSIRIGTVLANFSTIQGACVNKKIAFADSSSPSPISLKWYFGDGGTQTGQSVSHTYTATGQYNVRLVADFGTCTDSITKTITVANKPVASFTSTGDRGTCNLPSAIQFQNTSAGAATYLWSFGNGVNSANENPSYTYTKAGIYDVTLVAKSATGCNDTLVASQYVRLGPPVINSVTGNFTGCVNQDITFTPSISSGDSVTTYLWDFGDGGTASSQSPVHKYTTPGTYTVKLKVTTASGCTSTKQFNNLVQVGNKPVVKFSASPQEVCGSSPVHFTDESTGNITTWNWDFGDKSLQATVQNPSHSYADTGTFTVTLTAGSNGCIADEKIVGYIHVKGAIANFNDSIKCGQPSTVYFKDKNINASQWSWDFGDGQHSAAQNPSHTYTSPGQYLVKLTAKNNACSSTKTDTVVIANSAVSFSTMPAQTTFCKYTRITFSANYDPAFATSFYWSYGDGVNTGFGANKSTVTHLYNKSGSFTPYLVVLDYLGCRDTVKNASHKMHVFGPRANFTNPGGTCVNGTIMFTDKSTPDTVPHPIVQWIWNFGDGVTKTYTNAPFDHKYTTAGIYPVTLKVVDQYGCYDTTPNTHFDTITKPVAAFSSTDFTRCSSSPVNFIDSSQGILLAYSWDFGDGSSSTLPSPQHAYSTPGIYTVSLNITDKFGCPASIVKNGYIKINNPVASFKITDTTHYCPPWLIKPVSTSTSYTFLTWQFGDGNSSNITNPQHLYTEAGTYNLLLIAQGHGNCFDTARQKLIVFGPSGKLSYSPTAICKPGNVDFSATGKNIAAYTWILGDGEVQSTTTPYYTYTYKVPGTYMPQLTIIDSTGNCQVEVENTEDSIRVADVQASFGLNAAVGCDSALVIISDSSKIFFDTLKAITWNFGDGNIVNGPVTTHYYSTQGSKTVILTLQTNLGCTSTYSAPVNIIIHPAPAVRANIPASVCINTMANFSAADTASAGTINWLWQFGDGANDTLPVTSYTYTVANTFPVQVTATNEFGCADTVQGNITVDPLPAVDAGPDSVACLGQSITLQPSGATTYVWAASQSLSCTNCNNPVATPDTATTYYVAGTSAAGCSNIDSLVIDVKRPITITLKPIDTLCAGNTIQLNASGAEVYSWQPAGGLSDPGISNPVASPAVTTTYTVTGSDTKSCFSATASAEVRVFPVPSVSFKDTGVTLMQGDKYTMSSVYSPDVLRWLWAPPDGLSCNNCSQPVASPKQTTTYTETVFNQYGCSASANYTITVLCNQKSLFVPNTFSPNGDGVNDYFYPRGPGLYNIKSMRIFNRWGQLVFNRINIKANDILNGWDGKYKGKIQPSDVYVYTIEVICDNGTVLATHGNVTLLR
ncbi:MAG TPA: PKD domain-containing protein [Chitinophagaceae bacterium]|nr:PKD domain-containing protein [Chitinophagaceae bacterium]